jgi:hypothetical protein
MLKKSMVIIGGLLLSFALQGCAGTIQSINYQGKERPVEEVEEMISDYLESENPDLEFDIQITESVE